MLLYFDTTFFSVMKILDTNNESTVRKLALVLAYVLLCVNIVLPVFLITIIYRRFDILKIKAAKQSFNTLLMQIDKASKVRVANPAYFFLRRLSTAVLLTLPIDNTFIFLQYVFILMSSHAYILYLVAVKPYQTGGINSYVLSNETFYSALIIAIFIFSDATPELNIKFGAGLTLITSLVCLVLSNIITIIAFTILGRDKIKKQIKDNKLKRAEKEALERAEEEERKLKQKKEEEEFTRLPDESNNMSQTNMDQNSSNAANTFSELNMKSEKKKSRKDKVNKGDDNVSDADFVNSVSKLQDESSDVNLPKTKKRKLRDKDKAKTDDVTEGTVGEKDQEKEKKKRSRRHKDKDYNDTEFGTNPT